MSQPKSPLRANRLVPEPQSSFNGLSTQGSSLQSLLKELRVRSTQTSFTGANASSAWEAIWSNRTRSFLTLLGIVIGVAAVIGALTLAQGVGGYFQELIAGQGANTVFFSGSPATTRVTRLRQTHPSLTLRDLQVLTAIPHVVAISPVIRTSGQIVYGNQNWRTTGIQGVNTDFQTIQDWQLVDGLWFSQAQNVSGQPVAVLGDTVMHHLFDASGAEPVGKQIRIGTQLFRVVGVLAPKGAGQDDAVFIPYLAVQQRLTNSNYFPQVNAQVDSPQNVDQVVEAATFALELNHHIVRGTPDDFQTQTSAQLLQQSSQITSTISLLLSGLAAISLTVGGIGIMNIMLVSVTERTREIGIRISIGARRRDIRNQFLTEALFLCLLGGLIGMLLGIFIGWLVVSVIIGSLVSSSSGGASVPLVITPTTLILPFAVSSIVGVVFGIYPAIRASRLDPIVALRRAK